mgnify:CR=1 FL=1
MEYGKYYKYEDDNNKEKCYNCYRKQKEGGIVMKNLKFKIAMTNISRVIISFLFVNLSSLFQNSVQALDANSDVHIPQGPVEPMCYYAAYNAPQEVTFEKVFIIAVPIVLVIAGVSFLIIKRKKAKKNKVETKKEKKHVKKD